MSIKVSFIDLAQTEEYKDVASLQNVRLCDVINVEFEKYGISTTAKVVKTVYDVLADRYESIEVGSVRTGLTTTISDTNAANISTMEFKFGQASAETDAKITDATQNFPTRQEVQQDIDNATSWLTTTGGVIRALKNSDDEWTDLLCCSATATASTGNVLRFNVNGIGFSSTGWNGPFTQAWTLDGRLVIGGTNVPSLTVYDSNNNVIFQTDATKIIWNAPRTSMNQYGAIKCFQPSGTYRVFTLLDDGVLQFGVNDVVKSGIQGSESGGLEQYSEGYTYISGGYDNGSIPVIQNDVDLELYGKSRVEIQSAQGNVDIKSPTAVINLIGEYVEIISNTRLVLDPTDIYIKDGQSWVSGYTGTKNGCTFVNGICTG